MVRVCTINQNNFKRFSNLDLKYKFAIINGIQSKYQFTPKLENLDSITKEDVIEAYNDILNNSKKALAIVGALEKNDITCVYTLFTILNNSIN